MSEYRREKVLRVPIDKYILNFDCDEFEKNHKEIMGYKPGYFEVTYTNTGNKYLDFILEVDNNNEGWWGKTRNLFPNECIKYYDTFSFIIPNIKMSDVHLVDYCWYNGVEPDDYYDFTKDDFWKEIPDISELK